MARKTALKHDAQGFLVGDAVDMEALLAIWSGIRNDIRAIRHAVLGIKSAANQPEAQPNVATPRRRETAPTRAASAGQPQSAVQPKSKAWSPHAPLSAAMPKQSQAAQPARAASGLKSDGKAATTQKDATQTVSPRGRALRDDRGRFIAEPTSKQAARQAPPKQNYGDDSHEHDEHLFRTVGERVVSAVKETGHGLEEADPAVKAVNEIAQPMMRGYELLSGGNREKRKERWFRRIWQTLTGSRKEQGIFNKIAAKRLKAIEEKPVSEASSGGGFFGTLLALMAALFAKIPGLKKLLPAAAAMGVGAVAAGAATGAGKSPSSGKKPGRMARLLRRVPILGALIGGAGLAADLVASETDATQTRAQKDRRAGQGVGGLAGSLGGMAGGAKLGALAGAAGGPIGAAIGGVVGGALGLFLGDQAGQIIGDKVGLWVSYLREADIPGKIASAWNGAVDFIKGGWSEIKAVALGTWDWMKSGWDSVTGAMKSGWEATKKAAESAKDWVVEKGNAANNAIHEATGVDIKASVGSVVDGASNLASTAKNGIVRAGAAIADGAKNIKNAVVDFGSRAADKVSDTAGRAWSGAKSLLAKAVPQALLNKVAVRRAMETAADYRQGNIAGLDDAHTRALVASTAETESSGGKLNVVNSAGYMGRYQAGAAWLADAGLLKGGSAAVTAAMKADGFTNEYKWGQSGGMTRFLKNADNWKEGLDYDKYLASADIQDAAFKTNSDKTYRWLVSENLINDTTPQAEIAGLLKARHISGNKGAKQVARGGTGPVDANGTSARKYYNDLAAGSVYLEAFAPETVPQTPIEPASKSTASVTTVASATASAATPEPAAIAQASPQHTRPDFTAPAAPISVNVSASKIPSVPAIPSVSDTPPVSVPLAANDTSRSVSVVTVPTDVGQDLRERGIAHIVTGGLAR